MMDPKTDPSSPRDPAAEAAARRERRRPVLERCVELLQSRRRQSLARLTPDWTDAELAALEPLGEDVKAGRKSYTAATNEGRVVCPGRSSEAVRKKLKNYVNYGCFKP